MKVKVSSSIRVHYKPSVKLSPKKIQAGDSGGGWQSRAGCRMPSALCHGNSREGGSSAEKWRCVTGDNQGEKPPKQKQQMHNLEKKKVLPKIKAAAQAVPAKKEVNDKTVSNGSSQHYPGWLLILVGQTERRHPCGKGLTATRVGQRGQDSRCSHAQQETPSQKHVGQLGMRSMLSSFPS